MNEVGCNKSISGQPSRLQYLNKPNKQSMNSREFRSLLNKKQRWLFVSKSKNYSPAPEDEKSSNPLKLLPTKMAVSDVVSRKLCQNSISLYKNELSSHVDIKRSSVKSTCKENREPTSQISMACNTSHLFNRSDVAHSLCSPPWDKLFERYDILTFENSGSTLSDSADSKKSQSHHVQKNQQNCISYKTPTTYGILDYVDKGNKFESFICDEPNSNILKVTSKPSDVLSIEASAVNDAAEGNMLRTVNIENKKTSFNACRITSEHFIQTKKLKILSSSYLPLSSSSYSNSSSHEKLRKRNGEFVLDVSKHYFHDNRMNLSALELLSYSNVCSSDHMSSDLNGGNVSQDYNDNFCCNKEGFKKKTKINCCNNTKIYYDSSKGSSEDYFPSTSDEDKNEKKVTNFSSHSEGVEIEGRDTDVEE